MKYGMKKGAEKFPLMIVLSFTYKCNARCPNCPYNNSDIRKNYSDAKNMSLDVFEKIANEAGKHGAFLRFTGGGEPFLNPDIFQCAFYAKTNGCRIGIITNGSMHVNTLVDVADVMEFSVDAGTREEYKMARPGLDWDFLNYNINSAKKLKQKTRTVASIISQKGIDVDRAVAYWKDKVDKVQVRKYLTWGYNDDKSADKTPYIESDTPCPWLFERMNIDSRGDVTYCGEDIAFKYKFGNVMDKSIEEIWRGKEFESLRNFHLSGNGAKFPLCGNCPDWKFRTWDKDYWKLIDATSNPTA